LPIKEVQVISVKGKDNFKNISSVLKNSNFRNVEKIAFVRDADENAERAFRSIKDSIKSAIKS